MPRSERKRGRKETSTLADGDVRLTDYADAALPFSESGRVSKAVNIVPKSVRETRHWWECDEQDFLDDPRLVDEHSEELDDEDDATASCEDDQSRKTVAPSKLDGPFDSAWYPFDLWFLISKYIYPEDVSRFALICRRSYAVTSSSAFWRHLYKRFCCDPKLSGNIPEQFRPLALRRPYGLRTRVIKALFHSYGHFIERTRIPNGVSLSDTAVEQLYHGVCESTWWEHQRDSASGKAQWRFYFKFAQPLRNSRHQRGRRSSSGIHQGRFAHGDGSLDYLDDTWANLENGRCILKVTCGQYTEVPAVLSWRLSELTVSLCSDMRSHRLRLVFSEMGASKSTNTFKYYGAKEIAVLEAVQSVSVFDWWHPNYPLAVL